TIHVRAARRLAGWLCVSRCGLARRVTGDAQAPIAADDDVTHRGPHSQPVLGDGVRADLPRTRSTTVAATKTSGAATAPTHTAMSGAPGLARISVPGGGGGGLKRSDFVM